MPRILVALCRLQAGSRGGRVDCPPKPHTSSREGTRAALPLPRPGRPTCTASAGRGAGHAALPLGGARPCGGDGRGGHLPAGVTGSLPPCRPATGLRTRRPARAAGEPVCRRGRTPLGAPAQGGPQGLGLGSGLQCRAARHILPCHPLPRHLWGALVPKGTTSREP